MCALSNWMEAAELLATHLVLPELIATVASYLNGSGKNMFESELFRHDEHGFALALFPHTADLRIVVYYTHKAEVNAGAKCMVIEHLCLVNGLAHSFGNEPAQVVISMKQMYPGYSLTWQTFGQNSSDYYPRSACSWLDLGSWHSPMCRVYFPGGGAIQRANFSTAGRVVYDDTTNDPIACFSMQSEPCARFARIQSLRFFAGFHPLVSWMSSTSAPMHWISSGLRSFAYRAITPVKVLVKFSEAFLSEVLSAFLRPSVERKGHVTQLLFNLSFLKDQISPIPCCC